MCHFYVILFYLIERKPMTKCMVDTHKSKFKNNQAKGDLGTVSLERNLFDLSLLLGGWKRKRSMFLIQSCTISLWYFKEAQRLQEVWNKTVI